MNPSTPKRQASSPANAPPARTIPRTGASGLEASQHAHQSARDTSMEEDNFNLDPHSGLTSHEAARSSANTIAHHSQGTLQPTALAPLLGARNNPRSSAPLPARSSTTATPAAPQGHVDAFIVSKFDPSTRQFTHKSFRDTPFEPTIPGGFAALPSCEQFVKDNVDEDAAPPNKKNKHATQASQTQTKARRRLNNLLGPGDYRFRVHNSVNFDLDDDLTYTLEVEEKLENFFTTQHKMTHETYLAGKDKIAIQFTGTRREREVIITIPHDFPSLHNMHLEVGGHQMLFDSHGSLLPDHLVTIRVQGVPNKIEASVFAQYMMPLMMKMGPILEIWRQFYVNARTGSTVLTSTRVLLVELRDPRNHLQKASHAHPILHSLPGYINCADSVLELSYQHRFNYCHSCKDTGVIGRHTRCDCTSYPCVNCNLRGHTANACTAPSSKDKNASATPSVDVGNPLDDEAPVLDYFYGPSPLQ